MATDPIQLEVREKKLFEFIHTGLKYKRIIDDDSEITPPARQSPEMTSLPDPELSNLKEIADIFTAAHTLNEKDKLSTFITIEVNQ